MDDKKLTVEENIHGLKLVAETYIEYEELAKRQIEIDGGLTDGDLNDVIIGLLVTKILVLEGKLDEKYFESAIS